MFYLFVLPFVPQQKHYLQIVVCVTLKNICLYFPLFTLYHNKNIIYKNIHLFVLPCTTDLQIIVIYSSLCNTTKTFLDCLHLFVLPFVPQQKHYLQIILCVTLIYSSLCTFLYSVLHLFILLFVPQQKHYLQIIFCVTLIYSSLFIFCVYLFFPLYHNKNIIYKLYSVIHLFPFVPQQKHYLQIIVCVTLIYSSLCNFIYKL